LITRRNPLELSDKAAAPTVVRMRQALAERKLLAQRREAVRSYVRRVLA
jgi:hypothetical protein